MCCIVAVKSVPKLRNGSSIHVSFTSMDLQKNKKNMSVIPIKSVMEFNSLALISVTAHSDAGALI